MPSSTRPTGLLIVLLLASLLVAAAALMLVGSPQGPSGSSSHPPPSTGQLSLELPPFVWGILFLLPLLVGFVGLAIRRVRERSVQHRLLAPAVILLVLLLFLYVLLPSGGGGSVGYLTPGSPPATGNNSTATNTSNSSTGGNVTSSGDHPSSATAFHFDLAGTTLWMIGIGLCALVAFLAVPGVIARLADRRTRGGSASPPIRREEVAGAMAQAADLLEKGEEPRETIVGLYLTLLQLLTPRRGDLLTETPEEIRTGHLNPLGIPPQVALTLTRLFEEARYSSHPIDASTARRAQDALRRAQEALLREGTAS